MVGRHRTLDLLALGLILVVGALPLPFASVEEIPRNAFSLVISALLVLAALVAPLRTLPRAGLGLVAAQVALAALAGLQGLPWPASIIRGLSPRHWQLAAEAHTALLSPAYPSSAPASLAPELTWRVGAMMLALAATLLVTLVVAENSRHRSWLLAALLASGVFQVLYGALHWGRQEIWGRQVPGTAERMRGTFVNPDHFSFYLELLLPLAFALLWKSFRSEERRQRERREWFVAGALLLWLTLFAGVVLSGSRAGFLAAVAGTLVQAAMLALARRRLPLLWVGTTVVALGLGFVALVGLQAAFGRWLATSPGELAWNDRLTVWGGTWKLWQSFPWFGTGLGTFREAFPLAGVQGLPPDISYWHAHNDYLELLLTAGVVGVVLLALGVVPVVIALWQRFAAAPGSLGRSLALGGLGAAVAAGLHAVFDFAFSLPAVSATLVVILGLALAPPGGKPQTR